MPNTEIPAAIEAISQEDIEAQKKAAEQARANRNDRLWQFIGPAAGAVCLVGLEIARLGNLLDWIPKL